MSARVRAVGGRGQRQPRHVAMRVEQRPQLAVIGPEIMPPFADAMRFVDRDQRQPALVEQLAEALGRRPLRRDIEQVELARAKPLAGRARGRSSAEVSDGGADAERLGRADLVVHQRDQRRDDQRGAVAGQRRQLVAQRLARPGRHHRQRVLRRPSPGRSPAAAPRGTAAKPKTRRAGSSRGRSPVTHAASAAFLDSERSAAWRHHSSA